MAWKKTPNVAMYKGANWNTLVKKISNTSPEAAKLYALKHPEITFFFFCNEGMILEDLGSEGIFKAHDAVFFTGEPWFGSAPQCDSYQKTGVATVYITGNKDIGNIAGAGCYTMADGSPAIDIVCIGGANINKMPFPKGVVQLDKAATGQKGWAFAVGSTYFRDNFTRQDVDKLHSKGITVLLTLLNNHDGTGWSEFTDPADALNFVHQLKEIVDHYGFDGIDIDDEYSDNPNPNPESLVMVTTMMKERIPDIMITKALFQDADYFGPVYNGKTLADNLTYGWDMAYFEPPQITLPPYLNLGMTLNKLVRGFDINVPDGDSKKTDIDWLKTNGYAGVMLYPFAGDASIALMGKLVNLWHNSTTDWNKQPNCP